MNVAGSGSNGKGRACRYARRLAVVLANDVQQSDVYQIQLPPTSMFGKAKDENHMGLDAYVRHLAGYNFSITGVVTEMRFDPNAEAPRIYFRGVKRLTDEEREIVVEKSTSPEALAAIAFNPGSIDDPVMGPAKPQDPNDHGQHRGHTQGANDKSGHQQQQGHSVGDRLTIHKQSFRTLAHRGRDVYL